MELLQYGYLETYFVYIVLYARGQFVLIQRIVRKYLPASNVGVFYLEYILGILCAKGQLDTSICRAWKNLLPLERNLALKGKELLAFVKEQQDEGRRRVDDERERGNESARVKS